MSGMHVGGIEARGAAAGLLHYFCGISLQGLKKY
jgi:hypothetical protein